MKVSRHFGGTYRIQLQGTKVNTGSACCLAMSSLAYSFESKDGGDVPSKRWLIFTGLHSVITQKEGLLK
jgi:hypothetical protein